MISRLSTKASTEVLKVTLLLAGISFWTYVRAQPRVPRVVDFVDMKLQLTDEARQLVQQDVDALYASQMHLQKRLDKINLYFPIIERIFKEEGVPDEIKYLVIQESGLIADAVSASDAVGFWQFKDFTAREVGMRVDAIIDERKNIVSSTYGAAKYLKRNNFQFDNWAYAISAYQAGLGGVRRYVDSKYYGAKKMPVTKKSHWYLLKFLAHKIAFEPIIGGRHSEGLRLEEYTKGGGKTLKKIAKEAKIEEELLRYYNKWILRDAIPEDKTYTVILPIQGKLPKGLFDDQKNPDKEEDSSRIEQPDQLKFPDEIKPGLSGQRNAVIIRVNGVRAILAGTHDDLSSLAVEAGIPSDKLLKYNDLGQDKIESGRLYYIEKKKSKAAIGFHITQPDENLWEVAQRYAIQLDKLAKRNRIGPLDSIAAGQVLWLSGRRPKDTPFEYHDVTGQPLSIVQGNIHVDESEIPSDEKLKAVTITQPTTDGTNPDSVRTATTKQTETSEKVSAPVDLSRLQKTAKTHIVEAGETLWAIAKAHSIDISQIREWNNLTKYDVLRVGQRLFVAEPKIASRPARDTIIYVVKGGDTLYQIAKKYNMSVTELMDLNHKQNNILSVGEQLKVYRN